jgi:hypothetical protein
MDKKQKRRHPKVGHIMGQVDVFKASTRGGLAKPPRLTWGHIDAEARAKLDCLILKL